MPSIREMSKFIVSHLDNALAAFVGDYFGQNEDEIEEEVGGGQLAPLPNGGCLCLICGKKLSNTQNGRRHFNQMHQKNKKAQCSICKAVFKNRGSRDSHYYNKHRVTPAMIKNAIKVPQDQQQQY